MLKKIFRFITFSRFWNLQSGHKLTESVLTVMELDAINGFRISSFWIPHYEEHRCFRNGCAEMVMSVQSGYLAFAWEKCGAFYDSTKMK